VNIKNLKLLLLTSALNGFLVFVGINVGNIFGDFHRFTGALVAGYLSTLAVVTLTERKGLLEGAEWRTVLVFVVVGGAIAAFIAFLNALDWILIVLVFGIFSGLGALLGKYTSRFFVAK
jgi:hypothetical protein